MLMPIPMRPFSILVLALAVVSAACGPAPAGSSDSSSSSTGPVAADALHRQAQAALERYAAAAHAAGSGVTVVGELTGQIGDWEEAVGENNKIALMSGKVRAVGDLPADTPPAGEVRWTDGTTATVQLLSAVDALRGLVASSDQPCPECRVLEVTSARLASGPVETSRGSATVPLWKYTLNGTRVIVTRVAIANTLAVVPPPWDPNAAPQGVSIESAAGAPADRRITVSFIGAPGGADQPCGADYRAEAVESDLAIVVIVIAHDTPPGFGMGCSAVGAMRTAIAELAAPLGSRAVLEIKEGLPVRVTAP